jgi:hypothetical protein
VCHHTHNLVGLVVCWSGNFLVLTLKEVVRVGVLYENLQVDIKVHATVDVCCGGPRSREAYVTFPQPASPIETQRNVPFTYVVPCLSHSGMCPVHAGRGHAGAGNPQLQWKVLRGEDAQGRGAGRHVEASRGHAL